MKSPRSLQSIRLFSLKLLLAMALAGFFPAGMAYGQFTITVTATNFSGYAIPMDYSGLAFEDSKLPFGEFFNITNTPLLTLFEQMGIHSLRMGGATGDGPGATSYGQYTVDDLFNFVETDGCLSVIFQFPLHDGNLASITNLADHIWTNYAAYVTAFALGNESDWQSSNDPKTDDPAISNYVTFRAKWQTFAAAITNVAGGAVFSGPDTGDHYDNGEPDNPWPNGAWAENGTEWTTNFGYDEKNSGIVPFVDQHYYEDGGGITTSQALINAMMSPGWDTVTNQVLYNAMAAPALGDGLGYRFTEADESDTDGGVHGASDAFASAMWALDFMHWWAVRKCAGINFENSQPKPNNVIATGNLLNPKGYGIKAFDLGGHGYVLPCTTNNPNNLNVTAYAVGRAQDLYVTILNKHGASGGSNATVTVVPNGLSSASVAEIFLQAPSGLTSLTGTTLGGAEITNNAQWQGVWTAVSPETNGQCAITLAPATAAVVHLRAACAYEGPIEINNDGAVEMFGTGTDGDAWHNWQKNANVFGSNASQPTNWVDWNDIGAIGGSVTSVGATAVARNLDGTLEIFVSGSDGNVYNNYQLKPGGNGGGWNNLGGPAVTNLEVAVNSDGSLNVFGIGDNGDIWSDSEFAPGIGSIAGWSDLGAPSGAQIQPGFVVGENLDGRLEFLGVDASGRLWHILQESLGAGGWGTWSSLGGNVNSRLQVNRTLNGCLEIFGVDKASGTIDFIAQASAGGSWGSWNTSSLSGESIEPGFVVGQNADGRFEILGVDANGNVWHDWIKLNGGGWSGWSSLSGTGTSPQLVICNTRDGRLQAFGVDTANQNHIWSNWQTSPGGGWNGWVDFGSTGGVRFYPGQP